jgi:hypothetical protein
MCRPSLQADELHSIAAMKKVKKGTNMHIIIYRDVKKEKPCAPEYCKKRSLLPFFH